MEDRYTHASIRYARHAPCIVPKPLTISSRTEKALTGRIMASWDETRTFARLNLTYHRRLLLLPRLLLDVDLGHSYFARDIVCKGGSSQEDRQEVEAVGFDFVARIASDSRRRALGHG